MFKYKPGIVVCLLISVPLNLLAPTSSLLAEEIQIPRATEVSLVYDTELTPGDVAIGDVVTLHVSEAVMLDGVVIVNMNAGAQGEVIDSVEHKWGGEAAIEVALRSVDAVDGTEIPLAGKTRVQGKMGGGKYFGLVMLTMATVGIGYFFTKSWGSAKIEDGATATGLVSRDLMIDIP